MLYQTHTLQIQYPVDATLSTMALGCHWSLSVIVVLFMVYIRMVSVNNSMQQRKKQLVNKKNWKECGSCHIWICGYYPNSSLNTVIDIYKKLPVTKLVSVMMSINGTPQIIITSDTQLSHGTGQDEMNHSWMVVPQDVEGDHELPYFPVHKTHHGFFVRNFRKKKKSWWTYFNFSNLLEENRIVTYQN
jgi:hypothetical protein